MMPEDMDLTEYPYISVLIATRNRPQSLRRCLNSVTQQKYPHFEVVVLDDASDSSDVQKVVEEFKIWGVKYYRSEQSLGVAGSRNFLMHIAKGNILCIIDDDAYFTNDQALVYIAEVFRRRPEVGIAATKVVDYKTQYPQLLIPFPKTVLRRKPWLANTPGYVGYYVGTCHAIRREVIDRCGGYEELLIYGEEELDLSYRAVQAGFRIWYDPRIVVHHYPQASVVSRSKHIKHAELYHHVKNRFVLAWKYLPYRFMILYLLIWLLRLGFVAIRTSALLEYFSGICSGLRMLTKLQRKPISQETVSYLRKHYGRLFY